VTDVRSWLREIDEGYILDWANRGLLRRGHKLAEGLAVDSCGLYAQGGWGHIDGREQRLNAPGFNALHCSCPATGPCHHLVALLLCLKRQAQVDSVDSGGEGADRPAWLLIDPGQREKSLRKPYLQRAARLLRQGVTVTLEIAPQGLIGKIREREDYLVRIPASAGIAGSTCTCGAEHCAHRALAVLEALRQHGDYDPHGAGDKLLSEKRTGCIEQVLSWMRHLVLLGESSLGLATIERGQALVSELQQLDLAQPSRELQGLLQRLSEELSAQSGSDAAGIRRSLAPLWARLRALASRPLPQALQDLCGVHKRFYRRIDQLLLYPTGIEIWGQSDRAQGLSFYLYAPREQRWYQHGQVRSRQQAETSNWSPQRCLQQESWGDGPPYRALDGKSLLLVTGWVSADAQLSGRPGTRVTLLDEPPTLPVYYGYRQLARDYVISLPSLGTLGFHRFPAVVAIAGSEPAQLDEVQQRWSKWVFDPTGLGLRLELWLNTDTRGYLKELRQLEGMENAEMLVFGLVGGDGESLTLRPISIKLDPQSPWRHLSL